MNVIPFQPGKKATKINDVMQSKELLYEQLLRIEETIEGFKTKIARKEKWIHSGLLMNHRELQQRFIEELDQLRKERGIAEKDRKDVIMELMKIEGK